MWSIKGNVLVAKIPSLIPQNALNYNFEFKATFTLKFSCGGFPSGREATSLAAIYAM